MRGGKPRIDIDMFIEMALVYEGKQCLIWPFARNSAGYAHRTIDGKHTLISRHICEQVRGPAPSPGHEAAHSCGHGDKACMAKGHLRWKTRVENEADKEAHGTRLRGAKHPKIKITDDQVRQIKAMDDVPDRKIAALFGISQSHVASIQRGYRRVHV